MTQEKENEDWEVINLDDPDEHVEDAEGSDEDKKSSKTSDKTQKNQEDDVDFELEEEDDSESQGSPPEEEDPEEDEEGSPPKKGSRAERRIKRLLNRAKTAEEKLAEYDKKVKELQSNYEKVEGDYKRTEDFAIQSAEERIQSQEESLKAKYKDAWDEGDTDTMWSVNQELAKLASDRSILEQYKKRQPKQEEQADGQQQNQNNQNQAPPQNQQQGNVHPKTRQWYNRNKEWFGQDYEMTLAAREINDHLIQNEGVDPTTDEFYNELDTRLRKEFPDKFKSQNRGQQVQGARGPSNRKTSNKVKLTKEEMGFCDRENLSYKEFAKHKKELNNE